MFKSIGNNFGCAEITFKDVQEETYIVLNSTFTFGQTAAYRNAEELEIYVPDLTIGSSAEAGVYVSFKDRRGSNRYDGCTIARSRIKDRNTICIEKIPEMDGLGELTVHIFAMYSMTGTGRLVEKGEAANVRAVCSDPDIEASHVACVIGDRWAFLHMVLPYNVGLPTDKSIILVGFPEDIDAELPVCGATCQYHSGLMDGMHTASLRDGSISLTRDNLNSGISEADIPFIYAFLVRDGE